MTTSGFSWERKDLEKVVSLLQEYTEKLRLLSEWQIRYRNVRKRFLTLGMVTSASAGVVIVYFFGKNIVEFQNNKELLIAVMGLFFTIALFSFTYLNEDSRSRQNLFIAHQLAITVEKLIKTASQYREHANISMGMGEVFELDLRLAEAEATLMIYRRVFETRSHLSKILADF